LSDFAQVNLAHRTIKKALSLRDNASIRVESEGFEPSSKRREIQLSTCLFFD